MPYYMKRKKKGEDSPTTQGKRCGAPTLESLRDKLDKVFSRYIRLRDALPQGGGVFRCISCGQIKPISQADCGHYHSRRHNGTRFDEDNCHAECRACNRFSADHLIGYRENLTRKIGEQRFALLEVKARGIRKWSCFELQQLIKHYTALVKKLEKEKGIRL